MVLPSTHTQINSYCTSTGSHTYYLQLSLILLVKGQEVAKLLFDHNPDCVISPVRGRGGRGIKGIYRFWMEEREEEREKERRLNNLQNEGENKYD